MLTGDPSPDTGECSLRLPLFVLLDKFQASLIERWCSFHFFFDYKFLHLNACMYTQMSYACCT